MKEIIKDSLKKLLTDRYLFILIIFIILLALISSIFIGFSIHFSELQLVSHYSAFGFCKSCKRLCQSIFIGFSIHFSELQLVSHYSAFGVTHLYRNQWFYLFVFVIFAWVVALLHSTIAVKLLVIKDRHLAILLVWLGIGIIIMGWITAYSIINIWKPI